MYVTSTQLHSLSTLRATSSFFLDIHRLGRTARSGKTGRGLLIVAPFEDYFLQDLAAKNVSLTAISATQALPNGDLEACRAAVSQQLRDVPDKLKATAYRVRCYTPHPHTFPFTNEHSPLWTCVLTGFARQQSEGDQAPQMDLERARDRREGIHHGVFALGRRSAAWPTAADDESGRVHGHRTRRQVARIRGTTRPAGPQGR